MQYLPVPELGPTLDRYLEAVQPLLQEAEFARTHAAVEQFRSGDGPRCQHDLLRFAEQENAAGRSWLSQAWLASYLVLRTSLPQTSSATLQICLPVGGEGLDRAAAVVHRLARVHLAHLRGDLPPETTARGEPVCGLQRGVLAGGLRHPLPEVDEMREGRPGAGDREIGVLVGDRYVAMQISDADGRVLPRAALRRGLERAAAAAAQAEPGFSTVSGLGSEAAAPLLARLLTDEANAAVYERLTHALFLVDLLQTPGDTLEHLERLAFGSGATWAYKTLTYQIGLLDDFLAVHLEHTPVDGGTVRDIITRAQELEDLEDTENLDDTEQPEQREREDDLRVEPLSWNLTTELRERISREAQAVAQRAGQLHLRVVAVPAPVTDHLPYRVSDDAAQQWIFLYAQLATYGRVRSTYESVDMRHVQAGRTECLRPNNPAAVALVRALLAGEATQQQVDAALDAHKDWVRACKTGQGIDRHLLGLRLAAARLGLTPQIFADPAMARLATDLLSTTSLGDQAQVVRVGFAPTSVGGIGVNYSLVPGGYEFLLSHDDAATERFEEFVANLYAGAQAVRELLDRL